LPNCEVSIPTEKPHYDARTTIVRPSARMPQFAIYEADVNFVFFVASGQLPYSLTGSARAYGSRSVRERASRRASAVGGTSPYRARYQRTDNRLATPSRSRE